MQGDGVVLLSTPSRKGTTVSTLEYSDVRKALPGKDIYHAVLAMDDIFTTASRSRYQVTGNGTVLTNLATGEKWNGTVLQVRCRENGIRDYLVVMEENARGWSWVLRTSAIFMVEPVAA